MLAEQLTKLGNRLEELHIGDSIFWSSTVYISIVITINNDGEVVKVTQYPKPIIKNHPIMIYAGAFSNSDPKAITQPHLLCLKLKSLLDQESDGYGVFQKNLETLYMFSNNEIIRSLLATLHSCDFSEILKNSKIEVTNKLMREYVTFAYLREDCCILDDIKLQCDTDRFLNSILESKITGVCEVTGEGASDYVQAHMKMFRGGQSPRISTRHCYTTYYDPTYADDEKKLCRVSMKSELLMLKATAFLYASGSYPFRALQALVNMSDCSTISLRFSIRDYFPDGETDGIYYDEWLKVKNELICRSETALLKYFSFSPYSLGRISTGCLGIFNQTESQKMVQRIIQWIEAGSIWNEEGKLIYAMPTVYALIMNGISLGRLTDAEHYNLQVKLDQVVGYFRLGKWKEFLLLIVVPNLKRVIEEGRAYEARRMIECISKFMIGENDMSRFADRTEYSVGKFLAIADLIELTAIQDRYGQEYASKYVTVAQKALLNFHKNPLKEFLRVRKHVQQYMSMKAVKIRKLHMALEEAESAIRYMDYDCSSLEMAIILLGFDVQKQELYSRRKECEKDENSEDQSEKEAGSKTSITKEDESNA